MSLGKRTTPSAITSVEIAICTWNRYWLLQRTLETVDRLLVPDGIELRLLLVDNASTDQTADCIQKFAQSDFASRHDVVALHEPQQGHTFSRNRAIENSQADLILWTDDDVLLPVDWVQKYVDAANHQAESTFWGSVIEPEFVGGKPKWMESTWEIVKGCFAARDLGENRVPFTANRLPYGANFAIRGETQRATPFATELGRRGDSVLGEDELDLMRRLLAQGHSGAWVPGNGVKHVIPADRATTQYLYGYFVGQGRALVESGRAWHNDVSKLRREAKTEKRYYWLKRYLTPPEVWVSHLVRSALAQGQADSLDTGGSN